MDLMSLIKKMKDDTGIGVSECKSAIVEASYDYDRAIQILRERGRALALNKSSRAVSEGLVGYKLSQDGSKVVLIECNCETDFVSSNERFRALIDKLLDIALTIESDTLSVNNLLDTTFDGILSSEIVADAIASLGENIVINRVKVLKSNGSLIVPYVHNALSECIYMGQIVSLAFLKHDGVNIDLLSEFGKKVAMHIAAVAPLSLSRESLPRETIDAERAIYIEQVKSSGKPEAIWEKIVDGKMTKFYESSVLLDQTFIIDDKMTVSSALKEFENNTKHSVTLVDFVRMKVGDKSR